MSRPKKTDITQMVAEDLTSILDFLSRVIGAADDGSHHYMHDKAAELARAARRLYVHMSVPDPEAGPAEPLRHDESKRFDPARLRRFITIYARHYRAGRALYPADNSAEVAARRSALESAASDLRFGGPKDVPPAVADVIAGWLLARAEREGAQ